MLTNAGSAQDGILIPIPQYPIYSALIALLRGERIGYELIEEKNWGLDMEGMKKSVDQVCADVC